MSSSQAVYFFASSKKAPLHKPVEGTLSYKPWYPTMGILLTWKENYPESM
jgi:hypothetical protein